MADRKLDDPIFMHIGEGVGRQDEPAVRCTCETLEGGFDGVLGKFTRLLTAHYQRTDDPIAAEQWNSQ